MVLGRGRHKPFFLAAEDEPVEFLYLILEQTADRSAGTRLAAGTESTGEDRRIKPGVLKGIRRAALCHTLPPSKAIYEAAVHVFG